MRVLRVAGRADLAAFIDLPFRIYRDDPNWGGAPIPEPAADPLPDDVYRQIASKIRAELAAGSIQ